MSSKKLELDEFLKLAIRIVEILDNIHQHNIIHKDINPSNIVWNPETEMVKVIDFDIASQLSRETAAVLNPDKLEGTLSYMSPEQTGRMNRAMDYRTDLYSLGVTFYKILTGKLPFENDDKMELIHAHIAKTANSPDKENSEIPKVLSEIVMKLMRKTVEERYQSALGLKSDLALVLNQLNENGKVGDFEIGQNDISDRFQIPQRLYGRENEIDILIKTYEKTAAGSTELLLVSGYSGIGKSVLVNEIHKPVVEKKGYFISGKFDQFQKDIPYSAIAQAFSNLVKQLLSEPDEKLNTWKVNLLKAFGINGQIIIDVIPELELITGKQAPVQELKPTEAENRFMIIFRDFVKVFAKAEHPLTLFLDDLQWSDQPSLNIIKSLMIKENPHLFILGAYRDNEVNEGHPLLLMLDEIRIIRDINNLRLEPLTEKMINQIISDTLHCTPEYTQSLSNIIFKKTEGNPFFTKELFTNLYKETFLNFNHVKRCWEWDLDKIKETNITNNVVELMLVRLKKLSENSRESLQLASCIGNYFDLNTLSIIMERTIQETAKILFEAVKEEIVIPLSDKFRLVHLEETNLSENIDIACKFQHDNLQQAAYSMIEDSKRTKTHLVIGRLLLKNSRDEDINEKIVDIVRHLNEGNKLITNTREKEQLVRLNLLVGIKAKNSTAYLPAFKYLKTGIELLPENSWKDLYELTFSLNTEYAQCAYLTGKYDDAERCIETILKHAKTKFEKAEILAMQSCHYATISKYEKSILTAMKGLSLLGVKLPHNPNKFSIIREVLLAKWNLGNRKITELIDAPEIVDPKIKITMKLCSEMAPSAFLSGNENLTALLALKMTNLSLRYGISEGTAYSYTTYGLILGSILGNLKDAYEFGKLAISMMDRFMDMESKCRVILVYGLFIHHFNNHWTSLTPLFQKGIEAGYQSGDLQYLTRNAMMAVVWDPKLDLKSLIREQIKYRNIVKDCDLPDDLATATLWLQMFFNFRGLNNDRFSLSNSSFDEIDCLEGLKFRKNIVIVTLYYTLKSEIYFFYQNYSKALECINKAEKTIQTLLGMPHSVRFCILAFLTIAACYSAMNSKEKNQSLKRLKNKLKQMKKWANHCPGNFLHLQLIMEAETARLSEKYNLAVKLYDKAIEAANKNEWIRDEALANELAAKLYLHNGQEKAAMGYMQEAHYLYERWGADAKTAHLKETYPGLFEMMKRRSVGGDILSSAKIKSTSTGSSSSNELDLSTIMKSSLAISEVIKPDLLFKKMMHIVIENAGAQKGFLILNTENELFIEALAYAEKDEISVMKHIPIGQYDELAKTIINYVSHAHKSILLNDAANEGKFTQDPYVIRQKSKSILCIPLIRQNELYGILYLENNLTNSAFTSKHQEVLNILSSQIAISIENAQLYENLENKVVERTQNLEIAQKDALDAKVKAEDANRAKSVFLSNMSHELRTPLNAILGFSQLTTRIPQLTKTAKENLSIINRSGEHLLDLINSVLEMSKIEAGIDSLTIKAFDLYKTMDEIESLMRNRSDIKGLDLVFECSNKLPQFVETDENKLHQILLNLLGNAIKFTTKGSITLRLRPEENNSSTGDEKSVKLLFEIEDTGPGISEKDIVNIFQTFTQSSQGPDVQEGSGLGLSISRELVKLLGGDISVKSNLNKGSTFSFYIIAKIADIKKIEIKKSYKTVIGIEPGSTAPDGSPFRILVVEDKFENRTLLSRLLTEVGFDVKEAENGKQGLDITRDWQPHLIWMDIRMPVMNGYDAVKEIQSTTAKDNAIRPVIIALTALAFKEEKEKVLSKGFDDFARKPFKIDDIFEKMGKHIGVKYIYEGGDRESGPLINEKLISEELNTGIKALPSGIVCELQKAADLSDVKMVEEVVDRIRQQNSRLADALQGYAVNYSFDKILNALDKAKGQ